MKYNINFENASINRMGYLIFIFQKSTMEYLIYINIQKLK